jgi:hypothetical protein
MNELLEALIELLEHEGERTLLNCGIEVDTPELEEAKAKAQKAIIKTQTYLKGISHA